MRLLRNENSRVEELTINGEPPELRLHGWTWKATGALAGLFGGIITGICGSLLTAITWVAGPEWHGIMLRRYGTVLLFLTIPLLVLGAHFLDLMDKRVE